MKRLLALLLCAVMLFSVLGAEAFAADDGTLTVYSRSGGRRSVPVGETFTYTYALKLASTIYELDRIKLDVVYDDACLELVSAEYPNLEGQSASEKETPGNLRVEKSNFPRDTGSAFAQQILTVVTVTFRAVRAGTTYIRTLPEHIEVEGANNNKIDDVMFVSAYRTSAARDLLFSTYDYIGDVHLTNNTAKLNTAQDIVWFYIKDADGNPADAGQTFVLNGEDDNGKVLTFTAVTDEYGFVCFPRVPFGSYSIACDSLRADGSSYYVEDGSFNVPMVKNGTLSIRREIPVRVLAPEDMLDVRIDLRWADEYIDRNVPYTKDRPSSVSFELEAGGKTYAKGYLSAEKDSVEIKHLPRTAADGSDLEYEVFPGVTPHYEYELSRSDAGFTITLRYLNDHDWSKTRTEPDCETDGEVIYTCSECGTVYHYTLSALGHDYAVSGYDATCVKDGYHLYVCRRCGKWLPETTPATGHKWGEWIVDVEATDTEDGMMHRFCTVCGERQDRILAGPAHQHTLSERTVAPTCTEAGYTVVVCGCGYESSHYNIVPATGHDYTGNSATRTVVPNSCTEDGVKEYTCSHCGEMHAEILPAHGHDYLEIEKIEPTCTQKGYALSRCSHCGEEHKFYTEPLGHDYGAWIVDQVATSSTPGAKHRVCSRCDHVETAVIPRTETGHTHEYITKEVVDPTCTEPGYTKLLCACGDAFIDPDSHLDALGHDWDEDWRTASTTRTRGVVCYRCARCGILRYEALPKIDGEWKNTFWDVSTDDWFFDHVRYVSYNDYMNGTSTSRFEPDSPMTRAMLVTVLYRMVGSPSVSDLDMPFVDVPDEWFHDAVLWAYDTGVVRGVSADRFAPMDLITREQMVTIFHRYAEYAGYDVSRMASILGFRDAASVSDYARDSFAWAVAAKIVNGVDVDGVAYLQPQGTATRAQAAAIIQRFDAWRLK